MRKYALTALCSITLLQGCTIAKQFAEGVRCDGYCLKDYPGETLNVQRHDQLVILPPLYTLSIRQGNDEEVSTQSGFNDTFGKAFATETLGAARSYEIEQRYVPLAGLINPAFDNEPALRQLHDDLWAQDEDPEAIRDTTPLYGLGAPEIIDPVATRQLTLPPWPEEAFGDACCVLLMRVNGWSYTRGAAAANTGMAVAFSVLPGGSGYIPPSSDVVADAAVVRLEDNVVIWSARYIGPTNPVAMRRLLSPYFSKVYNANASLPRQTVN
ncbi:hypothetical protein S7S_02975 [Isoalcanivorax pacificus W11-5]|uniref:Lipoprotein n=1 Tax=Isoalcanivorax pacificus W11-5 TaxID=391936 RepID=A0A0B4XKZ4_9GAMM|nr:hypothetical protein [Isoalcanivorax pacificus]AJD47017.1 hypothetical protein S7S_02975 [Isoalcanivorax pacificus W11-5]